MIVQIETENFASAAAAADALDHVGKALLAGGDVDDALAAFDAAAEADIATPAASHGAGPTPWNVDTARATLFRDLLQAVQPNAVLLFGVARGETAAWVATIFDGPILANEEEPRLFLQARRLLTKWHNISVFNETPTALLPMVLPVLDGPVLIWLDACYSGSAQLADTIRLVIGRLPRAAILIDGLQSQPVMGVGYSVSPPGHATSMLAAFEYSPVNLFTTDLPTGNSADQHGTRCVVAAGLDGQAALAAVPALRPVDWTAWRIDGLRAEVAALRRHIGIQDRPV